MVRYAMILCLAATGCAETTTSAAPRRPWQQFCEQAWNVAHASQLASSRGAEGWELVAMYNGVLCYKRPGEARPFLPSASVPAPALQPPPALGPQYVPAVRDPGF